MKSISASGHKFGLAPLGCGWVIWRDEEALPQELVFNVDYLGGQIGTFAINFSRPAGQVIAQYYEFLRLGREGYTKVQNASYQVAAYLADEIAKLGPYEFICTGRPDEGIAYLADEIAKLGPYEFICTGRPDEGIPAVCFKLKDGEDPGYTLYDLSERLRLRGWQVPAFTRSVLQAINSVWLRWAAAGLSGVMKKRCRRNWCSTLTTWGVRLVLSPSTSPARQVR